MTLIRINRPGRIDRSVETDHDIDALLAAGSPVAIGVSGGKDSCAAALATIEHLNAIGHTGPRILIHADLGDPDPSMNVEWSDSLPTCERLAVATGCELMVVRRPAGGMMARWLGRWSNNLARYRSLSCVRVILPWSTPSMRFCTSELKSAPMASALVKRFPGQRIVSACGVRREESKDRSKAPTSKENVRLTNRAHRTTGVDWNPIAQWTEADVFAFCAARNFTMHEGYALGMGRISCAFCIMAKQGDLLISTTRNAAIYRTMVDLEIASGFAFQGSHWLGDLAPNLLTDVQRAKLISAKAKAARRDEIEARIPDHLLYVKGWPTAMPTQAEAEMLAEVRRDMAALYGMEIECTTADAVMARYAALMDTNALRNYEKSSKAARKARRSSRMEPS